MMPPKPARKGEQRYWFASHRVHDLGQWQAFNTVTEEWGTVSYEDLPDQMWRQPGSKRDGWTFYTDRTRECDGRGFPVKSEG